MNRSNLKAKRKHYDRSLTERTGILVADKIIVETEKTKTEMLWDLFDNVIESDNIILVAKDKEYMAFAPYMFSTKDEWEACKLLVLNKINGAPTNF